MAPAAPPPQVRGRVRRVADQFSDADVAGAARQLSKQLKGEEQEVEDLLRFEAENRELCDVVRKLPEKISHRVMVPFGPAAFFPGTLVHTNELLVLLGEGYYAQLSAHQTVEVLQRRGQLLKQKVAAAKATVKEHRSELQFFQDTARGAAEGLVEIEEFEAASGSEDGDGDDDGDGDGDGVAELKEAEGRGPFLEREQKSGALQASPGEGISRDETWREGAERGGTGRSERVEGGGQSGVEVKSKVKKVGDDEFDLKILARFAELEVEEEVAGRGGGEEEHAMEEEDEEEEDEEEEVEEEEGEEEVEEGGEGGEGSDIVKRWRDEMEKERSERVKRQNDLHGEHSDGLDYFGDLALSARERQHSFGKQEEHNQKKQKEQEQKHEEKEQRLTRRVSFVDGVKGRDSEGSKAADSRSGLTISSEQQKAFPGRVVERNAELLQPAAASVDQSVEPSKKPSRFKQRHLH